MPPKVDTGTDKNNDNREHIRLSHEINWKVKEMLKWHESGTLSNMLQATI